MLSIAVSLASFVAFLPTLQNGFIRWDDDRNLVDNPFYRGLSWPHLRWMWSNHLMEHYVPLSWMSFGLDYVIWRQQPFGYHLTNMLLHSVNAGLFFWLALRLLALSRQPGFEPGRTSPVTEPGVIFGAACAALLFALHPLRVESVAWATERRDVLSGGFYLLALLAYLRRFSREPGRPGGRKYYWWCLALFAAAILSKEITVTLPAVLLILDVYPLTRLSGAIRQWFAPASRGVWMEKIPFFAVGLADSIMVLRISLSRHVADSFQVMGWIPRSTITVYGMAFYLRKTVAPLHLSALYPWTRYNTDPAAAPFLISAALLLAITVAALNLRRRFPALLAVWLFYAITLLPVGGIFHNGYQIAADRYTYLACLGWALLAGAGISWCWRAVSRSPARRALLAGLAVLLLALLGRQTWTQIHFWHDSETFWGHVVSEQPSALALNGLGIEYFKDGDTLGSMDLYRRAIAMDPSFAFAHANLGGAYLDLHHLDDAMREFRITQQLTPSYAPAYDGIGNVLLMKGKASEAIREYQLAIQVDPNYAPARKGLALATSSMRPR